MKAIILSIGDELVLGQTVDTNSAYLSAELARQGIMTLYHQTVADDQAATARAIQLAAEEVELVIISGGLGPTEDDLTRQAMAEAMGTELVTDAVSLQTIADFFARRGRPMPERNAVQALHPRGTTMIPNSCGTAPGIKGRFGKAMFYVVPGVPREMKEMFRLSILPDLAQFQGRCILTCKINTFGLGESDVAERLGELMARGRNPTVGTTVSDGQVSVRVRSEFAESEQARRELEDTVGQVEQRVGPIAFGRDEVTLQEVVVGLLKTRGLTVATAESCTGGLIGKYLTDVAGSSAVYRGGWVTYANQMKERELGVPPDVLKAHGAVSAAVAEAMALGALREAGADLAVAVTGVAGPEGGSEAKPVGTVWIALAAKAGGAGEPGGPGVTALRFQLGDQRDMVRDRAAKCALQLLRLHALGLPLDTLTWGKRAAEQARAR